MPKVSKNTKADTARESAKAAAARKASKAAVPVKPMLVPSYRLEDPRTLRQREWEENVKRYISGYGNWERGRGFCAWGSRNKSLKEKKRLNSFLFSTEVNAAGYDNRQQQFVEDIKGYKEGRDGPAV